jgi:hypothetical protein
MNNSDFLFSSHTQALATLAGVPIIVVNKTQKKPVTTSPAAIPINIVQR